MKLLKILFLLAFTSTFSQQNLLQSGPMLGYVEMTEAKIWVQTKAPAKVKVEYSSPENPSETFISNEVSTVKDNAYTAHLILDKIRPGKKYNYKVLINNQPLKFNYETSFTAKKLWQWREDAPEFTVALGSCAYMNEPEVDRPGTPYGGNFEIFTSIGNKKPEIMLWGGDNIYLREADWDSKTGIYHRYTMTRQQKELQPLMANSQNFAIWDDHDFGPNDADRSYYFKHQTLEAFKDFWANKSYGNNPEQNNGNFSTFNWGDAEFFLLDNRFHKSPNDRKTGERTVLGKEQLEWFIDAVTTSKFPFKIVVIGGQFINSAAKFENYATYPEERQYILDELEKNNVKGVVFLSGDRHFSELSGLKRPGKYTLYDWTVSPLTSGVATSALKETNENRVEGSLFMQHNFGLLKFFGNKDNRALKLELFDKDGKTLWNKVITLKELQ